MGGETMISLYARIAAVAALLVALAGGGWWCYSQGKKTVMAEWTAERLATSENARLREQAAQRTNERIDHEFQTQKARLVADKRITDDRLREFAAINQPDNTTGASSGNHGAGGLERELLGNCAEALTSMGQTADRLEAKIVGLQSYVTKVCLAQ